MGFWTRRAEKRTPKPPQRARVVEEIRAAAANRDMDGIRERLSRRHGGFQLVPDVALMFELLIEEDSALAQDFWRAGFVAEHHFAWMPILSELVQRSSSDPLQLVDACRPWTMQGGKSPVPFAVANMLLRTQRGELAREVAERWVVDPMERSAVELSLCGDLAERRRKRDEMRRLFVDAGAPNPWCAILASCEALCEDDGRFIPRMLTAYNLSPLSSPLLTEVPPSGDGAFSLFLVRSHDTHLLTWSFVVAESDEEAGHWGEARVQPFDRGSEARRLYAVDAARAGFAMPIRPNAAIVEREVEGVGHRVCLDYTGMGVRRHFYTELQLTAADQIARMERWPKRTEEEDRDWPVPPEGTPLSLAHRKALETGLFA